MSCNDKLYPLKHHQVSMMCSLIAGQDYYYEKLVYRISGQLEVSRFIKTWQILSSHNDVLRSIYKWDNTKLPLQVVIEGKEIPILLFKTKEEYQSNPEYAEFKVDISINPLVVFLICVDSETYEMALHTHHILMDGWSHAVLINQFLTVYTLGAWPDGISSKALYSAYI